MGVRYGARMVYGFEPTKEELKLMREVVPEEELEEYLHYTDGYDGPEENNILIGIAKNTCNAGYHKQVSFAVSTEDDENLSKIARATGIRREPKWYIAATIS